MVSHLHVTAGPFPSPMLPVPPVCQRPPPPLQLAPKYNLGSTTGQVVPLHTSGLCCRPRILQSQAKVQNQDFLSFHLLLDFRSHSSTSLLLISAQPCPGPCPQAWSHQVLSAPLWKSCLPCYPPAEISVFINYTFNLSEFNHTCLTKMRGKRQGTHDQDNTWNCLENSTCCDPMGSECEATNLFLQLLDLANVWRVTKWINWVDGGVLVLQFPYSVSLFRCQIWL